MPKNYPKDLIRNLNKIYKISSHPYTVIYVVIITIGWFIAGYFLHFEEAWYKWFHLFEMCITLLMIFIIESTQQADDRALQEKLDEIIRALPKANEKKVGLEKKYKGTK